jgi:hypothetical protein
VLSESEELRNRLALFGYLYFRRFLPPEPILELRRRFLAILEEQGWLSPGTDPADAVANPLVACGDPDPDYLRVHALLFKVEEFHALPHHPLLMDLFERLFQDTVLLHPRGVARIFFPTADRFTTRPHQDHLAVRGTEETYTAWIPLGDCPQTLGSLQLAPATHLGGLRPTQPTPDNRGTEVRESHPTGSWVSGDFEVGDILVFHSLLVHRALPNSSDRLRLSVDYRYQPLSLPVHPARFALNDGFRSWASTYAGWNSSRFQYYWQTLRLNLMPSLNLLEESLEHTDDPREAATLKLLLDALSLARLSEASR